MRRSQGRPLTEYETHRILKLLKETDVSMPDIARAVGCSRSSVSRVNAKYNVRVYQKRRTSWEEAQTHSR